MSHRRVLVLGGARSGKSAFAERLAAASSAPVLYVATATAGDDEMTERIALHRAQRSSAWRTLELPIGLAAGIAAELRDRPAGPAVMILLEDLTLLLSNLMGADESQAEARAMQELSALLALPADLIMVSNEVGLGLVPPYPLGRHFRDALGRLNQSAAAACDDVFVIIAGLPLQLK